MKNRLFLVLSLLLLSSAYIMADSENDTDHVDSKYYHTHEGNEHVHDLRIALIDFQPDYISDSSSQIEGEWELYSFETTDGEMNDLVRGGAFDIRFKVTESYMQVSLVVKSNGKSYEDPHVNYSIENGVIQLENDDFQAGLKDGYLVYTMLGMDEAYRYTFVKK